MAPAPPSASTTSSDDAASITLPAQPSSCPAARRFVTQRLADADPQVRDNAALLVSELVANALLHAAGPVTVQVRRFGSRVRVEVADASPTTPSSKHYGVDAATGRGLHLVDVLAARWGAQRTLTGKTVWFDLEPDATDLPRAAGGAPVPPTHTPDTADAGAALAGGTTGDATVGAAPRGAGAVSVFLLGAPVQAMVRAEAQYAALYREFRLIVDQDPTQASAVPGRLLRLIDRLGARFQGFGPDVERRWNEALDHGEATVDMELRLPVEAAPFVEYYGALLDEADDYCRQAELLTVAAPPEALAVRRWAFGQLVDQCRGRQPTPWSGRFI